MLNFVPYFFSINIITKTNKNNAKYTYFAHKTYQVLHKVPKKSQLLMRARNHRYGTTISPYIFQISPLYQFSLGQFPKRFKNIGISIRYLVKCDHTKSNNITWMTTQIGLSFSTWMIDCFQWWHITKGLNIELECTLKINYRDAFESFDFIL